MTGRLLRILLAAVFVWSGLSKLIDPIFFFIALDAFGLPLPVGLLRYLTFFIPWVEVSAGSLLVLGVWIRPAAWVLASLLIAFSLAIVSLRLRGLDVNCPCFGSSDLICRGPLGNCHLIRNASLLALAIGVAILDRRHALDRSQSS